MSLDFCVDIAGLAWIRDIGVGGIAMDRFNLVAV